MNKTQFITRTSEAIGEVTRLATLCNQLNVCVVQVKILHEVGFADIAIMPAKEPIEHHKIHYNLDDIFFYGMSDVLQELNEVTRRLKQLLPRNMQGGHYDLRRLEA